MSILPTILAVLALTDAILEIFQKLDQWRNVMALEDQEKELIRDLAHKAIFLGLNALKVAGLSEEEIEIDYALTKEAFSALPPEKIGE